MQNLFITIVVFLNNNKNVQSQIWKTTNASFFMYRFIQCYVVLCESDVTIVLSGIVADGMLYVALFILWLYFIVF